MKTPQLGFQDAFADMPIVAVLRGITPEEALPIGEALYKAGILIMEVPLNSPDPLTSIARLAQALGDRCAVGAGTVLDSKQAKQVIAAGGRLVVAPNVNERLIRYCLKKGIEPVPGWATATEGLAACQAGARFLKLFPASSYGLGHIGAVKAVLPADARVLAVGGLTADSLASWFEAGAAGVGAGANLYRPGQPPEEVHATATELVNAFSRLGHQKEVKL